MKTKKQKENKLHVKTGDRVVVVSGKDRGKVSNVKKAIPQKNKVVVEEVNVVTKAMKANPRNVLIVHNLAKALVDCERFHEAVKYYKWALQIVPNNAQIHFDLGKCLKRQGKIQEAAKEFWKVIAIEPTNKPARIELGLITE